MKHLDYTRVIISDIQIKKISNIIFYAYYHDSFSQLSYTRNLLINFFYQQYGTVQSINNSANEDAHPFTLFMSRTVNNELILSLLVPIVRVMMMIVRGFLGEDQNANIKQEEILYVCFILKYL